MTIIAGIDEVGRGAFAGPLVAAAVVFKPSLLALPSRAFGSQEDARIRRVYLNDSKKLTKKQREVSAEWIKENALAWGIGKASAGYIDRHGLTKATFYAYRAALRQVQRTLDGPIDILMLDAFYLPRMRGLKKYQQFAFKKGDAKSPSVAAASIIAKVYRDDLMTKLAKISPYKRYSWEQNVGYGTRSHIQAIKTFGATKHHRQLFLKKIT